MGGAEPAMIYRITHVTAYRYGDPVATSHHLLHLAPRETERQVNRREELVVSPVPAARAERVDEVLSLRRGVCQDFAHLQIACLRSLGLPARYVSGYLVTTPPAGQPRLVGADASHAWLAVHCPGQSWVPADPTNDVVPDQNHI